MVAYDCRGVNETCLPGKTGWIIPPDRPGEFLSAVVRFALDPELRRGFGAGAPAFARKRFSRLPQAESTLDFLQSLAKQSP